MNETPVVTGREYGISAGIQKERRWSEQQEAFFAEMREGTQNVVFRARAGTGKTTTIIEGFRHAYEGTILYVVFNKKNQLEAKSKIKDPRVQPMTLHSLGYRYITRVWSGVKADDSVEYDRVAELIGRDVPDPVINNIIKMVGFAKNTMIAPDLDTIIEIAEQRELDCPDFEREADGGWTVEVMAQVAVDAMELARHRDEKNRISFNDMVWLPVANNWTREWFDLVVVDEAQDMNLPQLIMAKRSVKAGGRVVVVGDDRQAIYSFRGAVSNGLDYMKEELGAKELGLTITYRCPKSVVALAREYVPDYRAHDTAPSGEVLRMSLEGLTKTAQVGDVILSRMNAPIMPLCLSFLRRGIRARVEGRDIGKALLALIRSIKGRSSIGMPEFLRKVEAWRERQTKRALAKAKRKSTAEERIGQINDQADTLICLGEDLTGVAELETRIDSLFSDSTQGQPPCVLFSSTHKAKGLEWDRVFVLSSTYMRGRNGISAGLEEENIYYVAITRAKKSLILVS